MSASLLLLGRRRWPLWSPTAAGLVILSLVLVGQVVQELATPVLLVVVVAFSLGRRVAGAAGLVPVAAFAAVIVTAAGAQGVQSVGVGDVVYTAALVVAPYVFGRVVRDVAARNRRLQEQADLLARLQATVRHDAVAAERVRIARDLHDVMAHSLSAMVVQASAAEDVLARDPDRARRAMHDVAETGQRALAETGRLLHLIRDDDGELDLSPPGMTRLEELVDQFRRAGLAVDLQVTGRLHEMPAGVDLSGYRIVQEALTNALKYAPDGRASARVTVGQEDLVIVVENRGDPGPVLGSGLGLLGIRERVQVLRGTMEEGFTGDGRFAVSVRLPLAPASTPVQIAR